MNIIFVSKHDPSSVGGIGRVTDILAQKFLSDGHMIYVLSLIPTNDKAKPLYPYELIYFPEQSCESEDNIHFLNNFIKEHKIDVIINQYGAYLAESKLFTSCKNVINISEIHIDPRLIVNSYFHYLWNAGWRKRLLIPLIPYLKYRFNNKRKSFYKWLTQRNDAVVLLSEKFKHSYPQLLASNVYSIFNPIQNFMDPIYDTNQKEKNILFVGRLECIQKAPQELIYIFKEIESRHNDWRLIIIGDGPDKKKLENLANRLRIQNIEFTGFTNPQPYYTNAQFICQTSTNEGFPMVLGEAMAHKCIPLIYNSFAAAADIIDNEMNGMLIQPRDRKAMAKALDNLINDQEKRAAMAEAAYTKAQQFHIDNIAKQWYALFDKLIKE